MKWLLSWLLQKYVPQEHNVEARFTGWSESPPSLSLLCPGPVVPWRDMPSSWSAHCTHSSNPSTKRVPLSGRHIQYCCLSLLMLDWEEKKLISNSVWPLVKFYEFYEFTMKGFGTFEIRAWHLKLDGRCFCLHFPGCCSLNI